MVVVEEMDVLSSSSLVVVARAWMSQEKRRWRCETRRAGRWEANRRDCADTLELRRERESSLDPSMICKV